MKRFLFAAMLFATPAIAQQQQPSMTHDQTWNALFHQEAEERAKMTLRAVDLQGQVTSLQQQIDVMTKERDSLKANATKSAPAAP